MMAGAASGVEAGVLSGVLLLQAANTIKLAKRIDNFFILDFRYWFANVQSGSLP